MTANGEELYLSNSDYVEYEQAHYPPSLIAAHLAKYDAGGASPQETSVLPARVLLAKLRPSGYLLPAMDTLIEQHYHFRMPKIKARDWVIAAVVLMIALAIDTFTFLIMLFVTVAVFGIFKLVETIDKRNRD